MGGSGCIEKPDFRQFSLWEDVVVYERLILDNSTLGQCGGLVRTDILTISMLGGYGGLDSNVIGLFFGRVWCLERTDFRQFLIWEDVRVLKLPISIIFTLGRFDGVKGLVFVSFYLGRMWWTLKD